MEKQKDSLVKDIIKYAFILFAICFASGALMAIAYVGTKSRINEQKALKQRQALKQLFQEKDVTFEKVDDYWVVRFQGKFLGLAGLGSAYGYSSNIVVMAGIKPDSTISGISVISSSETPGLGENIKAIKSPYTLIGLLFGKKSSVTSEPIRPWFQEYYKGVKVSRLRVKKDGGDINAITGATITSRAVSKAAEDIAQKLTPFLSNFAN